MAYPQQPQPSWVRALNRSRPLFWIALAINLGFAYAMFQAIRAQSASGWCLDAQVEAGTCTRAVGGMIGPGWLALAWGVTDVVLGVMLWYSRRR